jgi:hypothetical protein
MFSIITGAEKTTKMGVAGESSAAMIAASLCHTFKDIDFQVRIFFPTNIRL